MRGAYLTRSRNLVLLLALLSSFVEIALFSNIWKPSAVYLWTLWTAPAWLGWYLLAIHSEKLAAAWGAWREKRADAKLPSHPAVEADSAEIGRLAAQMDTEIASHDSRPA